MKQVLHHIDSQQEQIENHQHPCTVRIFAVIVLYKMHPQDSSTLRTLLAAAQESAFLDLQILLWDNTPGGQDPGPLLPGVLYEQYPFNPGLARAYNHALHLAAAQHYSWLLTLDQDSILPTNFVDRMSQLARRFHGRSQVGAIVPQVADGGRNLSPFVLALGAIPKWFVSGYEGLPTSTVYAVNSAAMLHVEALLAVDGYDPMLPLDISDLNLFHRLGKAGKRVYVSGDLLVLHDFSLLNKAGRMSIQRYDALLLDECFFWDTQLGALARFERMVRLVGRFCRDFMRGQNVPFRRRTLAELWRRLTTSRRKRMEQWQVWAASRHDSVQRAFKAGS
jgi:GT2 family glycosyltransferase